MFSSLSIVYAHRDFFIVNKPVGVPMHDQDEGIIPLAKQLCDEQALFLCHRLDTVTSGCVILARNKEAAAVIGDLFSTRKIQKYYLAALSHRPSKKQGTIAGDMKNRRRGQHVLLKSRDNPAVTQFFSYGIENLARMAIVKPLTGKTHQIRVAMKSLGAPIIGDSLYGATKADRVNLHAWRLCFFYKNEKIDVDCLPNSGEIFTSTLFQQWLTAQGDCSLLPWPSFRLPEVKH